MKTVRTIATVLVLVKWLVVLALLSSMGDTSSGARIVGALVVTVVIAAVLAGIWHRPPRQ